MPMIPVHVETSTVAITSAVSMAIAFGFCRAMDLKPRISLAIAAGVGIALFSVGVIPIGLLVVVAIGAGVTLFRVMFNESTQESKSTASASSSVSQESISPLLAKLIRDVTLNSPDTSQFQPIVNVCPDLSEADQARLRICITVAQSAVFLWYFEQLPKAVGLGFRQQFSIAISDALSANPLEVALEDYVPSEDERAVFLSKGTQQIPIKKAADGRHQVRVVDLLLGLIRMRQAAYFEAIASDMAPSPIPFLRSGQLTVRGFAGSDDTAYPYAGPLATMIGVYLASMLASVHKTLAGSAP